MELIQVSMHIQQAHTAIVRPLAPHTGTLLTKSRRFAFGFTLNTYIQSREVLGVYMKENREREIQESLFMTIFLG